MRVDMSTRRPADVPDEGRPAVKADTEELDPDEVFEAAESEAAKLASNDLAFKVQAAETKRIEAYGPLLDTVLAARGFPVLGGSDQTLAASNQTNLDTSLKRAAKVAALAILADITRIAAKHC